MFNSLLLPTLLPLIIGSILAPTEVMIAIMLLQLPERGVLKAIGYASGGVVVRLAQGVLFALALSGGDLPLQSHDWHSVVLYTLLFVLGIVLLIAAYEQWRRSSVPQDTMPKWLERINRISVAEAFGIGVGQTLVSVNLWVFTLSALALIASADLGLQTAALTFLLFTILVELPVLVPILIRILLPKRSEAVLQSISGWIGQHQHVVLLVVAVVLGFFFLAKGVEGFVTYG